MPPKPQQTSEDVVAQVTAAITAQLQEFQLSLDAKYASLDARYNALTSSLSDQHSAIHDLHAQVARLDKPSSSTPPCALLPSQILKAQKSTETQFPPPPDSLAIKSPRIHLSTFDGSDPLDWIFQAEHGLFPQIQREMATLKLQTLSEAGDCAALIEEKLADSSSSVSYPAVAPGRPTRSETENSMALSLASIPLPHPPDLDDNDPSSFHVSLHALQGSTSYKTMKMTGSLMGHKVRVLIDSGSTHNLIQPRVAKLLGLRLVPAPPFSVVVGNGERLHCTGKVPSITIGLQSHNFTLDLFLLDIWGADVVLGVQWLAQIGPFLADYKALYMTFYDPYGNVVILHGDTPTQVSPATGQQGKQLWAQAIARADKGFSVANGLVFFHGRVVIPEGHTLQTTSL
ncbi:Aspartic peptidase [Corchorus olitorius]|uniref:Aspartic peptidase n=1 Tax=Corchorus olitorius TaxID=93759 RepID=A0A1R3KCY3_9ROSI|nr:Aspartic peptidase [Corchorus olitorius]